eukprot:7750911-Pyramimonas_sp.AAC.1
MNSCSGRTTGHNRMKIVIRPKKAQRGAGPKEPESSTPRRSLAGARALAPCGLLAANSGPQKPAREPPKRTPPRRSTKDPSAADEASETAPG